MAHRDFMSYRAPLTCHLIRRPTDPGSENFAQICALADGERYSAREAVELSSGSGPIE